MDPESSLSIPLVVALVLLCAFFTAVESAIVTLNDSKLRRLVEGGDKKAVLISKLVEHPGRFFATAKVGLTLAGSFAFALIWGSYGSLAADRLESTIGAALAVRGLGYGAVGVLAVLVILAFGEFIPKRLAARRHEKLAFVFAPVFWWFYLLFRPLVSLLGFVGEWASRLLGGAEDDEDKNVTQEEIRMLLDKGSEEGHVQESDKDMINNILDLEDTRVSELMVHRKEVVALDISAGLREVIETAVESGYTRIPVYEGDIDNIIGILHIKDLLGLVSHNEYPFDLSAYLRESLYVAQSTGCKLLFSALKAKKQWLAVVVDEYGGTAGIITMEDIIEEIVGEIQDEYDDEAPDEVALTVQGEYIIDGMADLEEICEKLGLNPDADELREFETIGGYIVGKLGAIPVEGQHPSVRAGDFVFTVGSVEERRVTKLTARRAEPPADENNPGEKEEG